MRRLLPRYPLTLIAVAVLALSFVVFVLVATRVVPLDGIWRALVIPAWLTLTLSAIIRTALPPASSVPYVAFLLAGTAVCLIPFLAIDWLVGRRRSHRVASAA